MLTDTALELITRTYPSMLPSTKLVRGRCADMDLTFPLLIPLVLANFQRDGFGVYDDNQGNRPNYQSTLSPIKLVPSPYDDTNHTVWVSTIIASIQVTRWVLTN